MDIDRFYQNEAVIVHAYIVTSELDDIKYSLCWTRYWFHENKTVSKHDPET